MSKPMVENFGGSGEFSAPALRELDHLCWTPVREFVVRANLPGLSKDDVSVEIDEGMLVLRGPRTHGRFYRAFAVPEGVNPDTTTAILKDGLLEIRIIASSDQRKHTKHIEIEAPSPEATGNAAA
jgi:HSP20 family molecular chaperone IbpA